MKRITTRIALALIGCIAIAVVSLGAVAQTRWDRTFDVPLPALAASADAGVIERGRYLVFGPAHCSYCHTPREQWPRLNAGEELPLIGGYELKLPIATLRSTNLTPDPETGIGRVSDGKLARMLRHNVRADGRTTIPLMEFQDMSDDDVVAIISYLRSVPAVRNPVPPSTFSPMGKLVMALFIRPTAPHGTPPAASPLEGPNVERGEYLANAVANCAGCHSPRNLADGSYTGPRFSGGTMDADDDPKLFFNVPNLTPHPTTGHLAQWTEELFIARFRAGARHANSHMPWEAYKRMTDDDLRAMYRYLMSLEPVENETGPMLQQR